MDYHGVENLWGFEKPMFFWTKDDFMSYLMYIDMVCDSVKQDYKRIVDYQTETGKTILSDEDKKTIIDAVIDWAHQYSIFRDESDSAAFPFASDINKADFQFEQLKKASETAAKLLSNIGIESQSKKAVETVHSPQGDSTAENVADIVKYGVIGLGIFLAYQIFKDFGR